MTRKNDKTAAKKRHDSEVERFKEAEREREAKRIAKLEKWEKHLEYRQQLAEERSNRMVEAPLPKEPPTIQDFPRAPKMQIDALMETDSGFASELGRAGQRVVSISYGQAKPKGPMSSGITKKRRMKSERDRVIVKSMHTLKVDKKKRRSAAGGEGQGQGEAMDTSK